MRVLIGTDGSSDAGDALDEVLCLPLPADTEISIVSAIPAPSFSRSLPPRAREEMTRVADAIVAKACQRAGERWRKVTGRVREGDARDVLVDTARAEASDLLVVGTRGRGTVASALLGSVSLGAARLAPCPVLVTRGLPHPLRSVTIALDGSQDSAAALKFFSGLPLSPALSVHLVAVVEPIPCPGTVPSIIAPQLVAAIQDHERERRRELDQVLAPVADELRPRVGAVTRTTVVGPPGPSIVAEAEKHTSDLIVVGARGLGIVKRLLLGSVSDYVLRHAACPALIVRPRGGHGG